MEITVAICLIGFLAAVACLYALQYGLYRWGVRRMPRQIYADKRPKKPTWL